MASSLTINPRKGGFTLVELLLTLAVGVLTIGGMIALMLSVQATAIPGSFAFTTSYGTNIFQQAPAPSQLQEAAILADRLQTAMDSASGVFVFGGNRSAPNADALMGALSPMTLSSLPASVTNLTAAAIPTDSNGLRSLLTGQSGVAFEPSFGLSDFTIVTISGLNVVSSITQVRRYSAAGMVYYETVLDDALSSARNATAGAARNRFAYRFALTAAEDAGWALPPGALHFWYRNDQTWQRIEEGPTRIVLPDPFVSAGAQRASDTASFSRFVFFPGVIL